ncbi:MAG TPA: class I SAM-dependent methyltransferase [Gemmatimonadales bacterium]|nr:class I SAM-dependent methyltransferase [Gemmatimonadales bacterium]
MEPYADHFSRLAPAYASCRPSYPDELFSYLAGLLDRHELAWDCAAGSGQATIPLARTFQRVLATDASAAMLDQAPRHPRIEYRVATAEKSGLSPGTADLVVVAQALHWLDLDRFYLEVARVLIPGGVLAVWTYGTQYLDDSGIDRLLQRFYTEVVGPYWPGERRHVESGYRNLPFPFPELEPPGFAMEERWSLPQLLGYLRTWSATQRFRDRKGRDPVDPLGRDIEALWGAPTALRRIRWPLSLRVGRRPA